MCVWLSTARAREVGGMVFLGLVGGWVQLRVGNALGRPTSHRSGCRGPQIRNKVGAPPRWAL